MTSHLVAVAFVGLGLLASTPGQNPLSRASTEPQEPAQAKPVIVTATRTEADPFELPYSTSSLDGVEIRTWKQSRTTPETLKELPAISVQKTAHGQGSPKIRGQTGFQTLLLVDGIRINDSTWRSGNVEYWNHLDPYSFERFEVVRGPSSVLWGSDAVSGTGHAIQKGRQSFAKGLHAEGLLLSRYASAEHSIITHGEFNGNVDSFGWHLGLSYKDFDDLSAGRDVGLLRDTNYTEADGDLKLTWKIDEHQSLSFGAQQNHLRDVPRTHSTVDANTTWRGVTAGTDLQREHDHRRQLYWLQWSAEGGAWFDRAVATLAYKDRYEQEDRVTSSRRRDIAALDVGTIGGYLQFENTLGPGSLVYGADYYHDSVESDSRSFAPNGTLTTVSPRGVVAGDADYDLLGAFAEYHFPTGKQLEWLAGVRFNYAAMDAREVDVPGDSVTFDNIEDDWSAVTGSLRAIYKCCDPARVFAGVSQGFRAPNLSDSTRFDIARSGEVEVPAEGLDSEHYTTFELGSRYDDGTMTLAGTGWYTIAQDQISRFRTGGTVNGLPEVSKGNIGDGWYAGFELEASYGLAAIGLEQWDVFGFFDYVDGRIDQINNAGVEIEDRPNATPPPSGLIGLRWEDLHHKRGFEVNVRMAYHVNPGRYTESDAADTQRIPPHGLPGYAVVNIRTWVEVCPNLIASLAVENLNDVDYRMMASGLNEPGTNAIVTLQARF